MASRSDNISVLVVDDDPAMCRMIALSLRVAGYEAATVPHGEAALSALEERPFDVILLDLMMPVMDGRTFFRELRARGDKTPVIVLSAYGARDAQRELNAEAALSKPFLPERLEETINSLVAG